MKEKNSKIEYLVYLFLILSSVTGLLTVFLIDRLGDLEKRFELETEAVEAARYVRIPCSLLHDERLESEIWREDIYKHKYWEKHPPRTMNGYCWIDTTLLVQIVVDNAPHQP